jgi:hypothetical protein
MSVVYANFKYAYRMEGGFFFGIGSAPPSACGSVIGSEDHAAATGAVCNSRAAPSM